MKDYATKNVMFYWKGWVGGSCDFPPSLLCQLEGVHFQMLLPNRGKASVLFDQSLGKHRTDRVKLRNCVFNLRFKYDYKRITGNIDILIPIFRAFYCYSISITSPLHSHCPTLSLTRASEASRTRIILLYDLTQKTNCLFPLLTTCPSAIQIR